MLVSYCNVFITVWFPLCVRLRFTVVSPTPHPSAVRLATWCTRYRKHTLPINEGLTDVDWFNCHQVTIIAATELAVIRQLVWFLVYYYLFHKERQIYGLVIYVGTSLPITLKAVWQIFIKTLWTSCQQKWPRIFIFIIVYYNHYDCCANMWARSDTDATECRVLNFC
jgi:hypothetical protein